MKIQIEPGQKFDRLTVIKLDDSIKSTHHFYVCKCDCGNIKSINKYSIARGSSRSCGCIKREQLVERNHSHGLSKSKTYGSWSTMKSRCTNKNFPKYESYGARGIKICDKWMAFEGFLEDMGERPAGMTIDRLDVDGDYCKENCRWATTSQQARNKTNTRYITAFGRTQCLADWSDETGIDHRTIGVRISRGWTTEEALTP